MTVNQTERKNNVNEVKCHNPNRDKFILEIMNRIKGLVFSLYPTYVRTHPQDREDMEQECLIAAMEAYDRHQSKNEQMVMAYVINNAKYAAKKYINKQIPITSFPNGSSVLYIHNLYMEGKSIDEISSKTGRSREFVRSCIEAMDYCSLDAPSCQNNTTALGSTVPSKNDTYESITILASISDCCSDEIDDRILAFRMKGLAMRETGDILGLHRDEVCQRLIRLYQAYTGRTYVIDNTEDEWLRMIGAVLAGSANLSDVADELGEQIDNVQKRLFFLRENGRKPDGLLRQLTAAHTDGKALCALKQLLSGCFTDVERQIIRLYLQGFSQKQIETLLGLSEHSVSERLSCIRSGIEKSNEKSYYAEGNPQESLEAMRPFCCNDTDLDIARLRLQGYNNRRISEQLELTETTVRKRYERLISRYKAKTTADMIQKRKMWTDEEKAQIMSRENSTEYLAEQFGLTKSAVTNLRHKWKKQGYTDN